MSVFYQPAAFKTGEKFLLTQIEIRKFFCLSIMLAVSLFLENEFARVILFAFPVLAFPLLKLKYKNKDRLRGLDSISYFSAASLVTMLLFGNVFPGAIILPAAAVIIPEISKSIAERKIKSAVFNLTADAKSASGSVAYFISGAAVLAAGMLIFPDIYTARIGAASAASYVIYSAVVIAFVGLLVEAMSSRGLNYFFGVLIYAVLVQIFSSAVSIELINSFSEGLFFAFVIAAASYRFRFLTLNGSVATFLLAGFLFGFGGIKWSVPILSFFILSSLLSKARKKINEEVELYFEKSGVRDYAQVLANGGLGGILVVLDLVHHKEIFYLLYISVLAAVCADTWATEIGTLKRTPTYNILNFKRVEQGISGGISVPGILASIMASAVIALSGLFWIESDNPTYILFIMLAGTAGSLFDSFLGATVQVQHKCSVCLKITEREVHCGTETHYFKGIHWINNDIVNLAAGIAGGLTVIFLNAFI